ncbi:MAG: DUF89 family protein [Theionarchaea archaeon]|nr:DUF89 family protein [Theionarchaea archaeon]
MDIHLDCIPCFLRQALQAARFVTTDEEEQEKVVRSILALLQESDFHCTPPEIAHKVHFTTIELLGVHDPYQKVKQESNESILAIYESLQSEIDQSDDPLDTAIRLSIAGNIMDYGANTSFNIFHTIKKIKNSNLAIDCTEELKKDLQHAHTVAYFVDNAGEIVFDRLVIETVEKVYGKKSWHLYVKGHPIINDATTEDARQAGLVSLSSVTVKSLGVEKEYDQRTDSLFLETLSQYDVCISKGQGNYEAFSTAGIPFYFVLMIKCPVLASDIGVSIGDIAVIKVR